MTEGKKAGGFGIWIILGVLAVILIAAVIGSIRHVKTSDMQKLARTMPGDTHIPTHTIVAVKPQGTIETKTPQPVKLHVIAPPASPPPAMLAVGKNLPGTLKLDSNVLQTEGKERRLPLDYTCYRNNISPPLQWSGAPAKTRTFVVFLERREKDKPAYLKWAVFNISAKAKGLPANLPKQPNVYTDGTAQATSDQNAAVYVGPCEPHGKVDYVFRLFALDETLKLSGGAAKDDLIRAMNGHIIDVAELPVLHYLHL